MEEKVGEQEVELEALNKKIVALQGKLEREDQEGRNARTIYEQKIQEVNSRGDKQLEMLEWNTTLIQKVQANMESLENAQNTLAELLGNLDEGLNAEIFVWRHQKLQHKKIQLISHKR